MSRSNQIAINNSIASATLASLYNEIPTIKLVNRDYSTMFGNQARQNGNTIQVPVPSRPFGGYGSAIVTNPVIETTVPVTLQQANVGYNFGGLELTLDIKDKGKRYIQDAGIYLGNLVETGITSLYKNVSQSVGTPGTPVTDTDVVYTAQTILDEQSVPSNGRSLVLDPKTRQSLSGSIVTRFNPVPAVSGAFKDGMISGAFAGFSAYATNNIAQHTFGTWSGTPLVNGTIVNGATTMALDGLTPGSQFNVGDILSFAGCNSVNPISRQSNIRLKQVTIQSCTVADSGGNATITFSPALIGPNGTSLNVNQNVDALPLNNAAVTVFGASGAKSRVSLAFHRDAFTLAMVDLMALDVPSFARVRSDKYGISLAVSKAANIENYANVLRADILFGANILRESFCVRVHS